MFGSVSLADTIDHLQSSTGHRSRTAQTWTLDLSLADSETASGGEEGYEENVETNSVFYRSEFGDELVSEHAAEGRAQPTAAGAPQTSVGGRAPSGVFIPDQRVVYRALGC